MNAAVIILTLVLACNAPRRRVALSVDDTRIVAMGAALTAIALFAVGAVATPLIDALDVSAPNLRIAAGLVLTVVSLHDLVRRPPARGAALPGQRAAIVPVFFPVLMRPEVALVALVLGADHGVGYTALGVVLAMAAVVVWHRVGAMRQEHAVFGRVERGLGILDAGMTAALAVALVIDGVLAI